MLRPTPRVRPETRISVRRRRPSEVVELTETTEQEFHAFIHQFESDPLFVSLRDRGLISKVGLKGRIPKDKYDTYADVEMVRLIKTHGISDKPGWFEELSTSEAVRNPFRFAPEYGVDAAIIRRVAHYLRRLDWDDAPSFSGTELDTDRIPDRQTSAASLQEDDPAEVCSEFVQRYGIGPEDFVAAFLHDEPDASSIAQGFGAPIAEVRRVLASVASARLFEAFSGSPDAAPAPPVEAERPTEQTVVATVAPSPRTGIPILSVDPDGVYAQTYRLTPSGIEALYSLVEDTKAADQLLLRLRLINQRKSLLCRLVGAVFRRQFHYFSTRDELRLKPLGQAELARALEEHPSTICRAIRHKALRFAGSDRPLQWYCQRKRDVIARVVAVDAERSDSEIASVLRTRYGCKISRRTVNYHRRQAGAGAI